MDTRATSHMIASQGNLSSYFNLSKNNEIVVGNGHSIPIRGYGHTTYLPLTLLLLSKMFFMLLNLLKIWYPLESLLLIIL